MRDRDEKTNRKSRVDCRVDSPLTWSEWGCAAVCNCTELLASFRVVLSVLNSGKTSHHAPDANERWILWLVLNLLLHFAWVVDEAKCILVTRSCMCMCLCAYLSVRYRMPTLLHGPRCNMGNGTGCPYPSCALLDGFALGARVSLLWQHSAEREVWASACTRSVPG